MAKVVIKKTNKPNLKEDFEQYSKEELINKIKALQAHNTQLRNLLEKCTEQQQDKISQKSFDFDKCTFRHILLKFYYLGWDYQGYATQEDTTNTIEYHIFNALTLTRLIKDRTSSNYHRCGRTDKGVSSFGQVISLDIRSKLVKEDQGNIKDEIDYCKVLNRVLPNNIQCIGWCPVEEDFSARFNCNNRIYKYFFPKGYLNIQRMEDASKLLLGTHDFRNFCKMDVGNGVVEFIRNISDIKIQPLDSKDNEYSMYVIIIKGKAFLWHQIRCVMAILILIGQNKEEPEVINELFDIENNPRKPDYTMASELPLTLYFCEYENIPDWNYSEESLNSTIQKLKEIWAFTSVKQNMVKMMLDDLQNICCKTSEDESVSQKCLSEYLIQGVKRRKYIPLNKRQKCESLEDKIKHYVKRSRLEIKNVKDT